VVVFRGGRRGAGGLHRLVRLRGRHFASMTEIQDHGKKVIP
jgi:hypothetical protein